jgi:hypothetical protein
MIACALGITAAVWVAVAPSEGLAQNVVSASPDITIALGATPEIVADEDVAVDNQVGVVLLENLGAIPNGSEIVAFGLDTNGDRLVSFDTTTALSDGTIARPGDVVRYDGAGYSIEFDAAAQGVPNGTQTDAASLAAGGLLLSFDTTVSLGGITIADEDVVHWDGSSFSLLFDGSSVGLADALDVDAAQDLGGGSLLVSFDTSGTIGGIAFDDEDVLRFDGANWTLEFDGSAADPNWGAADLDAVPEPTFFSLLAAGTLSIGVAFRRGRRSRADRSS